MGSGRRRLLAAKHQRREEKQNQKPAAEETPKSVTLSTLKGCRRCEDVHGGQYVRALPQTQMTASDNL